MILAFFVSLFGVFHSLNFIDIIKYKNAISNSNIDKAIESLERLDSSQAKYNLGNLYYKNGLYALALKCYKDVKSSNRDFKSKLFYNMGNTYLKLFKYQEAKEYYKMALKLKYDEDYILNYEAIKDISFELPVDRTIINESIKEISQSTLFKRLGVEKRSFTFDEIEVLNGKK